MALRSTPLHMKNVIVLLAGLLMLGGLLASNPESNVFSQKVDDNKYVVYVYIVDDVATVYLNDRRIGRVTKGDAATFDLTPHLVIGANRLRLVAENIVGSYSYGFDVVKDGEVISSFECSLLDVECPKTAQPGVVFDRTITINYAPSKNGDDGNSARLPANAANYAGGGRYPRNGANYAVNSANTWNGSSNTWTPDPEANSAFNTSLANVAANAMVVRPIPWRGGVPKLVPKLLDESEDKVRLSVRYPQISSKLETAGGFNYESSRLVKTEVEYFRRSIEAIPPGRPHSITITYKTGVVDSRVISVAFAVNESSGEGRPALYTQMLNYDLKEQRILELSDLFRPNSNYLRSISDYCIRTLRNKVSDYEALRRGAEPSETNYLGWVITRTGIQITFDNYQVASSAEGPQTVLVPYSILKPYVRPGSAISHLVR